MLRMMIAIASVLLLAVAIFVMKPKPVPINMPINIHGSMITPALKLKHFTMQDQNGHVFKRKNLKHHWTLVFFGFTNCAMICPTTLIAVNEMMQILSKQQKTLPQVVLITVDPERDTTTRLRNYLSEFNTKFVGLTGSHNEIEQLKAAFGVLSFKMQANNHQYSIDHSSQIYILNPEGKIVASLDYPHRGVELAADYLRIMNIAR